MRVTILILDVDLIALKKLIIFDMLHNVCAILLLKGSESKGIMEDILALSNEEASWLSSEIKKYRSQYIKSPGDYLKILVSDNCVDFSDIKTNASQIIEKLREGCWQLYLKDEAIFNKKIIAHLIKHRELPNRILNEYIENFKICKSTNLNDDLGELIGEYTGSIMPYIYALDLSTTNSRRSRSGKTFEAIIKYLIIDVFKYPFDDQSTIGDGFFREQYLGKIVDGIIPGKNSYIRNRTKTLIITMKTTLRERWQEVAEEMKRTNIPQIHLLTVDDSLTVSKLRTMERQNIQIVNYDSVKNQFKNHNNIISFTEFFNKEIPHYLKYWEKQI